MTRTIPCLLGTVMQERGLELRPGAGVEAPVVGFVRLKNYHDACLGTVLLPERKWCECECHHRQEQD